jgi:hypothetical protein
LDLTSIRLGQIVCRGGFAAQSRVADLLSQRRPPGLIYFLKFPRLMLA